MGLKSFFLDRITFGWEPIGKVHQQDLDKARNNGVSGFQLSYVIQGSRMCLNVMPSKIMMQPKMIAAIRNLAKSEQFNFESRLMTVNYLSSLATENGLLSGRKIHQGDTSVLDGMIIILNSTIIFIS